MDPRERNRLKRERIEKNRVTFRLKVEAFYLEFFPEKWEGARDLLFIKYGTREKEFNELLIDRYGDKFKNFKPPTKAVKTAAEVQADRVRKYEMFNGKMESTDTNVEGESAPSDGRGSCNSCGRKFASNRLVQHEVICFKTKSKTHAKETEVDVVVEESVYSDQESAEIEQLEAQLKQLKLLKARKVAANSQ